MSDLSDLLTLLIKKRENERIAVYLLFYEEKKITEKSKTYQNYDCSQFFLSESLVFFCERKSERAKERMSDSIKKTIDLLIRSFIMNDLSESLTVAHLL